MILEIAELTIRDGEDSAFEAGVAKAVPLFLRAKGCHSVSLHRVFEVPNRYRLAVEWDSIDDHMIHFRESEDFQEWRRLVGPYFDEPPVVTHSRTILAFPAKPAK